MGPVKLRNALTLRVLLGFTCNTSQNDPDTKALRGTLIFEASGARLHIQITRFPFLTSPHTTKSTDRYSARNRLSALAHLFFNFFSSNLVGSKRMSAAHHFGGCNFLSSPILTELEQFPVFSKPPRVPKSTDSTAFCLPSELESSNLNFGS